MEPDGGVSVKLFLFDLDDTLIDTKSAMREAKRQFKALNGFSDEDMRNFDSIFDPFSSKEERIELWKEYLQTQTAHPVNSLSCYSTFEDLRLKGLSVMPWVRKVFETLHDNGILYAILTNGHPSIQKGKVTASGIFDWDCGKNITVFYGYESETSVPKPNPKIFHSACGHFNIAYESAVMVGDTLETDIAGARNANLGYAIHLKCGKTSHDCTRVDGLSTKVLEAYSHDHVLELVHALLQQNLHAL